MIIHMHIYVCVSERDREKEVDACMFIDVSTYMIKEKTHRQNHTRTHAPIHIRIKTLAKISL